MRLLPWEILLTNLYGGFHKERHERVWEPKEEAYARLKQLSGQDFGYDVEAWRNYIEAKGGPAKAFPGLDPWLKSDEPNQE
jgi:hypothetical protein